MLTENERRVAEAYDSTGYEPELGRPERNPVEFTITKRMLAKWVPSGAIVAEVGVGSGVYSKFLAERHCRLHLIDIVPRFLSHTLGLLKEAGLSERVLGTWELSATDLGSIESKSVDAVILMGPLYHLGTLAERSQAVKEAHRVLRSNGLVFAVGVNRMAFLRDLFKGNAASITERRSQIDEFMQDGIVNTSIIGRMHLTTASEFRALFDGGFRELAFQGLEAFSQVPQQVLTSLATTASEHWLDIIETAAQTPEGIGHSDHFLYVGSKRPI